jgi:hypothetical protein
MNTNIVSNLNNINNTANNTNTNNIIKQTYPISIQTDNNLQIQKQPQQQITKQFSSYNNINTNINPNKYNYPSPLSHY